MNKIMMDSALTTGILMEYIKQGLSDKQIVSEIIQRCDFAVNTRDVRIALNFLRNRKND